jgi:RNA polymerase sigma-70 factor (ECF subfamily)
MTEWPSILAEHGAKVWQTVYRLLDHHADALDCYQETCLAAWRFAERASVADWRSFLVSVATRKAMDRLRQRYRERNRIVAIESLCEPSSEVECPIRYARARELMERVREALAELPDKQAQVFWLSCIEGLSHKQISDQIQVPPGEVRVLLHRARARLSAMLDQSVSKGEDDEPKSADQG